MRKKQFPLRLDPNVYDAIERWAADELRSVNAHIEFLLRDAARKAGRMNKDLAENKFGTGHPNVSPSSRKSEDDKDASEPEED